MRSPRSIIAVAILALGLTEAIFAETVDTTIGQGIGTVVGDAFGDGSNVSIATSVSEVRYDGPRTVKGRGLSHLEVTGTMKGIGWGGIRQSLSPPGPPTEAFTHYSYTVPFVLRWHHEFDGTLVHYSHGLVTLAENLFFDNLLGPANEGRRMELGAGFLSDALLQPERRNAFFSVNLSGLGHDGNFTVTVAEGPLAGQPLVASFDAPIVRDLTQVAERLLEQLSGLPVQRVLGVGHSAGAITLQFIGGGVATQLFGPPKRIFSGGNHVDAYDPASELIFDGFIPIAGADLLVNPAFPLAAPMILIGGTADYAAVDSVSYAGRLRNNGVNLDDSVRIYHLANMPHVFAEITESVPNVTQAAEDEFEITIGRDSDRMTPVLAAMIDRLKSWVTEGTPPPASRIAGVPTDTGGDGVPDEVRFEQSGGAFTRLFPYVDDPSIDVTTAFQVDLSTGAGLGSLVARYAQVLGAHAHEAGAVRLPYQTCRLGGYVLSSNALLQPFADLRTRWPEFGDYNACLKAAVAELELSGLYDGKMARRGIVTESIRGLFGL